MRKIFYPLFAGLILGYNGFAQEDSTLNMTQENDTNYWYRNKTVFEQLDTRNIPSGLLLDYGMQYTDLSLYDGQSLDVNKAVSFTTLEQINSTLLSAQMTDKSRGLLSTQDLYNKVRLNPQEGHLRLSGLLYQYEQLNDANNVTVGDGVFYNKYDEHHTLLNPFTTKHVFAMALPVAQIHGSSFTIDLPANLFQSNMSAGVTSVQVNADDGKGWITAQLGSSFQVVYTTAGSKNWQFAVTLADGTRWWSNGHMEVIMNATADRHFKFTGTTPYQGVVNSAHISINYGGSNHDHLRKPLIIVEGFDPGDVLTPEETYGLTDIQSYFEDAKNQLSIFNPGNALIQNLNSGQYDLVYIDWDQGTDYLERNSALLEDIIKWVNTDKAAGGSSEPNVVWGLSMGGVISRYALKDLEDNNYNHQVRLFINHDGPQQGANVPYGAQAMAAHLLSMNLNYGQIVNQVPSGSIPITGAQGINNALSLGERPAAQEMLIYQHSYLDLFNSYNLTGPGTHTQWQQKLKDKGYPALCRNVAISNGSECGLAQPVSQINPLLYINANARVGYLTQLGLSIIPYINVYINLFHGTPLQSFSITNLFGVSGSWNWVPGANYYTANFKINSALENIQTTVYDGSLKYTKSVFWLIDVDAFNSHSIAHITENKALDLYPGGAFSNSIGSGSYDTSSSLGFTIHADYSVAGQFGFVPTASTLDIGSNNVPLSPSIYYNRYSGTQPPAAPYNTPFASFITAYAPTGSSNNNEEHIQITSRNAQFAGLELAYNPNTPTVTTNSCANGCSDKQISGTGMVCPGGSAAFEIPFTTNGSDAVTWSISPTTSVALAPSGNQCTVTNQGAQGDFTLTATIHTVCGNATYTKAIFLGSPNVWLATIPVVNQGEVVAVGPDCMPGIIQVQWYAPYVNSFTQTFPNGSSGYPCWFDGPFYANSYNYPITVNATVVTSCGVSLLSVPYTFGGPSSGPVPVNPYSSGTSNNGALANPDDPNTPFSMGDDRIDVSPNPATNYWNLNSFGKEGTYSLSDISGKNFITDKSFNGNTSINASKMANGIYFLKVQTRNSRKVFKLVKE